MPQKHESNSNTDEIRRFRLLFSKNRTNYADNLKDAREILSIGETIFKNRSNAEVFYYFSQCGAATAWVLQHELSMPEATVYRVLKLFRVKGYIYPAIKVSKIRNSKGGPRPTVWAFEGASKEEISQAIRLHFRVLSPKYRVAEEVAQTILEDYLVKQELEEVTYREILIVVREMRIPFKTPDIADLAAQYLHEKGVKVWR